MLKLSPCTVHNTSVKTCLFGLAKWENVSARPLGLAKWGHWRLCPYACAFLVVANVVPIRVTHRSHKRLVDGALMQELRNSHLPNCFGARCGEDHGRADGRAEIDRTCAGWSPSLALLTVGLCLRTTDVAHSPGDTPRLPIRRCDCASFVEALLVVIVPCSSKSFKRHKKSNSCFLHK